MTITRRLATPRFPSEGTRNCSWRSMVESKSGKPRSPRSTRPPRRRSCEVAHGWPTTSNRAVEARSVRLRGRAVADHDNLRARRTLWRLADLMERHADGSPSSSARQPASRTASPEGADVALAIECFRYMAGWATKIEGTTIPILGPLRPRGPVPCLHPPGSRRGGLGQIIPELPAPDGAWNSDPA